MRRLNKGKHFREVAGLVLLVALTIIPSDVLPCTQGPSAGVQDRRAPRRPDFYVHHFPDPVNALNGNLFMAFQDLYMPARGAPLELTRTYNSRGMYRGIFGHGWLSSLEVGLEQTDKDSVQIKDWDGSVQLYSRDPKREERFLPVWASTQSVERKGDGTFVRSIGNCVKEIFSPQGRLIRREDNRGQGIRLKYAPDGSRVVEVADSSGRVLRLSYTDGEAGFVREVTDPLNRTLRYDYDPQGNLIAVVGFVGEVTRFAYDSDHNLTAMTLPDGGRITNFYDTANDFVLRQEGPGAKKTIYEYHPLSEANPTQRTVVTDAKGNKTTFSYLFDPGGMNRVTITDATGAQTTQEYDAKGSLVASTDALGQRTTSTHDDQGRLLSVVNPLGGKDQFTYMDAGDCMKPTSVQDALGHAVKIHYDSNCQVAEVINSIGRSTRFEYNAAGDLTEAVTPDGARRRYQYDSYGNISRITDPGGRIVQYARDLLGRITEEVAAGGQRYRYSHDAKGRLIETVHPTGYRATLRYDSADHIIAVDNGDGQFTFEYNDAGLLVAARDADGNTLRWSHDEAGNVVGTADSKGVQTTRKLDALGRLVEIADSSNRKVSFQRDALGRLTRITNAANYSTMFSYNPADEVVEESFGDGMLKKSYAYDKAGQVLSVSVEPSGVRTEFRYDALGNMVSRASGGVTTTYEYDAMNRLSQVREDGKVVYTSGYGPSGELLNASGPEGAIRLAYNPEGLLESIAQSGMEIRYIYDPYGRVSSRIDAEGQKTVYTYDAADRLAKLAAPNGGEFVFSYDKTGRLSELAYPNGLKAGTGYDRAGNVVLERVNDRAGKVVFQRKTEYDLYRNPVRVEDLSGDIWRYSYDSMGRLIEAGTPGNAWSYSYDPLGNRSQMTRNGVTTTYSYAGDLLTQMATGAERVRFSYDARGNLVREQSESRDIHYRYDFMDRLVQAKGANPQFDLQVAYDALGRKVREVSDGVVKTTLLDGFEVVAEYVAGKPKRKYVGGVDVDQLLAVVDDGGSAKYLIQDRQMSVVGATDRAGKWLGRVSYGPFGEADNPSASSRDYYYYGGRPALGKTGLVDNRLRFYRPDLGRFLSRDLISIGHAYTYGSNNPVVYTEPLGLAGIYSGILGPLNKVAQRLQAQQAMKSKDPKAAAREKQLVNELLKVKFGPKAAEHLAAYLPKKAVELVKHLPAVKQVEALEKIIAVIEEGKGAKEVLKGGKPLRDWIKEHAADKIAEAVGVDAVKGIYDTLKEIGEEQRGSCP